MYKDFDGHLPLLANTGPGMPCPAPYNYMKSAGPDCRFWSKHETAARIGVHGWLYEPEWV